MDKKFYLLPAVEKPAGFLYNAIMMRMHACIDLITAVLTLCLFIVWTASPVSAHETDILAMRGIRVTGGAAPGYIPDRVCAVCHTKIYRSYGEVGMAKSFYRPAADRFIENFEKNRFYHAPSKMHYEMIRRDYRLFFKQYQAGADGEPVNVFETTVDWIMGSGNHSRVYFYRTGAGELYQLPLAWYTQDGEWGMSPGFDRPDHQGVTRRVRRECMFCHNAYPDVAAGSDRYEAPQVFPEEIPEGTGCQRCHGPGAEHVRIVYSGEMEPETVRGAIVNPARLSPERRDEVCFQCHLQPAVAFFGPRRFQRGDYSFRPGETLGDYLLHMDIKEEGKERIDRFEINHHPYRLRQSRCFSGSNGALNCLTCHDPHRKVAAENRAEHYRAACLTCHQPEHCTVKKNNEIKTEGKDLSDCVSCHMPPRRTRDVVKVVMTDHLIQRFPGGKESLAPLKETEPVIVDAFFLNPSQAPAGDEGEIYRTAAILRAGGGASVVDRLKMLLDRTKSTQLVPYLDFAKGQLGLRRYAEVGETLKMILEKVPDHELAREWMVITLAGMNRGGEAVTLARDVVTKNPGSAEASFNLGRLLSGGRLYEEAVVYFDRALALRPNMAAAWYHRGNALVRFRKPAEAVHSFERALVFAPSSIEVYKVLGEVLFQVGERDRAFRWLRHGAAVVPNPGLLIEMIATYSRSLKEKN